MTVPEITVERLADLSVEPVAPASAKHPRALRIGLIRNRRSHRNKRRPADPAELAQVPETVTLATPASLAELHTALQRFAADRIDVLAIDGGDGTVRDVLTCGSQVFGAHWPQLLLVPKGKTNALAVDLGIPSRWQLADGLHALGGGRTIVRHPIVIERDGAAPAEAQDWGFIFGAGAFNAAIDTGQVAHRFGAFQDFAVACTAAMGVVQALFGFGKTPWRHSAKARIVTPDGRDLPHSAYGPRDERYLVLFSTLRRFPAGIAPFDPAHGDIRFLLLDAPIRRVTARLPAILWGGKRRFYPKIGVHRGMGTAFDLDLAEGFILDGEAFPPGRIRMRQGPELHFIVP